MENPAKERQHEGQQDSNQQQKPASAREREFNEAVERVYRRYGNDLSAFYRDVRRAQRAQLVKRGSE
jgi:hypothetical protein